MFCFWAKVWAGLAGHELGVKDQRSGNEREVLVGHEAEGRTRLCLLRDFGGCGAGVDPDVEGGGDEEGEGNGEDQGCGDELCGR